MLQQIAKILQKKYPNLDVEYSQILCCIYIYEKSYWVLAICEDTIRYHIKLHYSITPSDPDYFQTIDKLLSDFIRV